MACSGVYTMWRGTEFVYVGIAGRSLDLAAEHKRKRGVRDRLDSHGSGRRSGDQFAVYVCDRLVLRTLSRGQIQQIAAGEISLDASTRVYNHEDLSYRFAATMSYTEAMNIETAFARGETAARVSATRSGAAQTAPLNAQSQSNEAGLLRATPCMANGRSLVNVSKTQHDSVVGSRSAPSTTLRFGATCAMRAFSQPNQSPISVSPNYLPDSSWPRLKDRR